MDDALQSTFPSWSWTSVKAPIQTATRMVETISYRVRNHKGDVLAFSDFRDNAVDRNLQPEVLSSDALAIRGHLLEGRPESGPCQGVHTFECASIISPQQCTSLTVTVDDATSELDVCQLYFLSLAAGTTTWEEKTYSGTGLVLITSDDYALHVDSRLKKLIVALVTCTKRNEAARLLRMDLKALSAWRFKIAKFDRETPERVGRVFRRVGVVHFDDVETEGWEAVLMTGEKNIWLD